MFSPIWRRFPVWLSFKRVGKKTPTSFTNDSMWPCNATTFEFPWRSMRQDQHDLTGEIYFAIFAFYVTRTVFFCEKDLRGVKVSTCWYNKGQRYLISRKTWIHNWTLPVIRLLTPLIGVITNPNCQVISTFTGFLTPFTTSRGPPCYERGHQSLNYFDLCRLVVCSMGTYGTPPKLPPPRNKALIRPY